MRRLPHTRSCFVCGLNNPAGLRLDFETDESVVRTEFIPGPEHAGFKETLHGGIISTVLDEVMVWVCGVRGKRFTYCAELNVRFLKPARAGHALTAEGALVSNRGNRLFEAKAELRDPQGKVLAMATGKYLPIPDNVVADLMSDFVESTEGLFGEEMGVAQPLPDETGR